MNEKPIYNGEEYETKKQITSFNGECEHHEDVTIEVPIFNGEQ